MRYLTVSPAYGRDYKSAKDAKADWNAGKDFLIQDFQHSGYITKHEADNAGFKVNIRFAKMTKITNA